MTRRPIHRDEAAAARAAGVPHFMPSYPCSQGHRALRYSRNGSCTLCNQERVERHRAKMRADAPRELRPRYTPAEDKAIIALKARGLSCATIANVLRKLGMPKRDRSSIDAHIKALAKREARAANGDGKPARRPWQYQAGAD